MVGLFLYQPIKEGNKKEAVQKVLDSLFIW
jgi:hypothetical protein